MGRSEWAIVAGAGLNGLGVARSLGVEGVRVAVIDSGEPGPAFSSRYARVKVRRAPDRGSRGFVEAVAALAGRLDGTPALFLTQEACVTAVSEHRALLDGLVHHLMPDAATTALLLSKEATQARAEAIGFPVPRTVQMAGPHESAAARTLAYPVVLKPTAKSEAWERTNKKAYRFDSYDELARVYAEIGEGGPPVVVQEWIEGTDADVYFTLVWRDPAGAQTAFSGRKLRQWPPNVGGTASCAPAPVEVAAELATLTGRFFDAVGCVGMASIEYKRDARTGRFLMVEPTVARTDYQQEVATLNGVNLPAIAYASLTGEATPREWARAIIARVGPTVARVEPPPPTIWRDAESDARSAAAQPGLALPSGVAGMRVVDALDRADDRGPARAALIARVRRAVASRLGLAAGR